MALSLTLLIVFIALSMLALVFGGSEEAGAAIFSVIIAWIIALTAMIILTVDDCNEMKEDAVRDYQLQQQYNNRQDNE